MESYAKVRLQLGRSALYSYLRVFEWVNQNHPDWLNPGPDTFIPELNDVVDLIWMEQELDRKDLSPKAKTGLETLKAKALEGTLTKSDVASFRKRTGNTKDNGLKAFLSQLRVMRMRGSQLAAMPPEIITGLDELIAVLGNAINVNIVRLESPRTGKKTKVA